jgi:signal peptidase I
MGTVRSTLTSRVVLGILIVAVVVNVALFVTQRWIAVPLEVPSASMEPALRPGDRIIVRRTHQSVRQLARSLHRGDVLVFRAPERGHPLVVKRVIGLPGETIQAKNGLIAIDNARVLDERWLPKSERELGSAAAATVDIKRTDLETDEVYVLGDNRDNSIDSRSYGPVELDEVVGAVALRFWPPSRFGTVTWR